MRLAKKKAIDELEEIPVERNTNEELHWTRAKHTKYRSLLGQITLVSKLDTASMLLQVFQIEKDCALYNIGRIVLLYEVLFGSCQFLRGLWIDLSGEIANIHMGTAAKNLVTTARSIQLPEQKETIHTISLCCEKKLVQGIFMILHIFQLRTVWQIV